LYFNGIVGYNFWLSVNIFYLCLKNTIPNYFLYQRMNLGRARVR